ncbi:MULTISPECIES: DUF1330 domain-containing protein [unclassified Burkholderia]|uniref:DUF1330 domain-containing protein n=1 Tax=unclassified Burkholderia TaxID=2613784 RepID=UPI002AB10B5B|nr:MULTISPECIES: DUF1330 domain-containing protein [unclassified Burkholderia]
MTKGYWVVSYRSILDTRKLGKYAELASKAIHDSGGRIVVRGVPAATHDEGISELAVVVEFESLDAAMAARDSEAYQIALAALTGAVERDFRIVAGS